MSDCSACARSAIACTTAISISRVMVVAPQSSAPRKMYGKHSTLLTWFGIVRTAGRHDGVVAHRLDFFRQDFRGRVGQRQDQRLGGHRLHHLRLEHAAGRQAEEDVGAGNHLGQRARAGVLREALLVRVHQLGAALVDHAGQVGDEDVLDREAEVDDQVRQASAAAPAPDTTSLQFLMSLPTTFRPFRMAAPTMIAVPCWSSWKTGIFMRSRSLRSM